jgi:competence protein ComEC
MLLGALFILPSLQTDFPPGHVSSLNDLETGPFGANLEGVLTSAPEDSVGITRVYLNATRFFPEEGPARKITGRLRLTINRKGPGNPPVQKLYRGDRVRFFAKLQRPRNFKNPGAFDYEWWLARQKIFVTGRVPNSDFLVKIDNTNSGLFKNIELLRERVNGFIDSFGENSGREEASAVIKALVTGERADMDEATREAFIRSGTAHILAISGLHIGVVALLSYLLFFNILRLSEKISLALNIRKLSWALALVPVVFYGLLAGMPVSTQRAIIMIAAFVFAYLLDRSRDLYATLALAALLVLAVHPGSLWEASFQFSFAAVFAIFYLVKRFDVIFTTKSEVHLPKKENKKLAWFIYRFKILLFITAAASIATLPLTAYHFNNVALVGMPLNLIAVPISSLLIVPLSIISALFIPISETLSTFLLTIDSLLIGSVIGIIKSVSSPGWSMLKVSTITIIEIASFYLLIFSLFNFKKRRYLLYALPLLLTGLLGPAVINYYQKITSDALRITFLDVGQGEASFIEFPGGKSMLIDGGGAFKNGFDMGEMVIAPFLRYKRIKKIDYMVMSHAQLDHMGGLPGIAKDFRIGEFWHSGREETPVLTSAIERSGTESVIINNESKPKEISGVKVRFLSPPPKDKEREELNINEASLVMELTYKKKRILFTGDIGLLTEGLILDKIKKTDLLKAPHHGSRYSSSPSFIEKLTPEFTVFSAGFKNRFNFPHKETLARYKIINTRVFRTDRDGAVEAITDGERLELNSYQNPL